MNDYRNFIPQLPSQSVKDFLHQTEMKKNIEITLDQARDLYKDEKFKEIILNSFTKEELEKPKLPSSSFSDLIGRKGYYVDFDSSSSKKNYISSYFGANTFATKEQANAVLAMAQLSQHMDIWNGSSDWADWKNRDQIKYILSFDCDGIRYGSSILFPCFLHFKTDEMSRLFYETFKDLIEQAKPLL